MDFSVCGKVRSLHRLFAVSHLVFIGVTAWGAIIAIDLCPREVPIACFVTAFASAVRILWMIGSAVSQAAVASTMLSEQLEPGLVPSSTIAVAGSKTTPTIRHKQRMWYVRWVWWGRFGAFVTVLQLVGAAYLTFLFLKYASTDTNSCYSVDSVGGWHRGVFLALALAAWLLTITHCCLGPDILAWSSLYAQHDDAWRAYYHVMFDYGIREALCCFGRAKYITGIDDEVDSVAAVLGDLVSYRAAGAGHLEFLAGLALLQLGSSAPSLYERSAPTSLIREAAVLHPFAVAAYTGPLLDIGRNPFMFPCAWLYRQGVLTPWNRNRRPKLDGDNWWRGHAAAFLKHSKLPPEALRQGRVHQAKRECAYFVIVVHELQSVVIAVRGTETPEDLLTDGLGRESILTDADLAGLLQSDRILETVKQQLISSSPHFAHEGIIAAARELAQQLDNLSEDGQDDTGSTGLENSHASKEPGILWKLLGPGGECEGYVLNFVGHSLGGSIAALTALRFYARYPQVHAYGYGVLPCVDASVADACSGFVTSIVYNDEFSSRLSISSIKRLRIAAVKALASEPSLDFGTVTKLARRILGPQQPVISLNNTEAFVKDVTVVKPLSKHKGRRFKLRLKGREGNNDDEESEVLFVDNVEKHRDPCTSHSAVEDDGNHSTWELRSIIESGQTGEASVCCESNDIAQTLYAHHFEDHDGYCEMFMPGLIVHIVPESQSRSLLSWDFWGKKVQQGRQHRAFIKDRTDFQNLVISMSMFLDHMPWRCQFALNHVLELENAASKEINGCTDSLV